MKQSRLEWRVGLFVCLALAILMAGILFFGNKAMWRRGYDLHVHFRFTNGVEVGAPVRFSGVNIGEVKDIRILDEGGIVDVELFIREDVALHNDVSVYVNTLGVMGEKYIEFLGGSPTAPLLGSEAPPLRGTDPFAINDMSQLVQTIAQDLSSVVRGLSMVLGNEQTQKELRQTVSQVNALSGHVNDLVMANKDHVSTTMELMHANMQMLNEVMLGIREGKGFVGQMLTDEELYQNIKDLVADVKAHPWKLLSKPRNTEKKSDKKQTSLSAKERMNFR